MRREHEVADAAATVLRWTIGAPDGVEVSVLNGCVTLEGTVTSLAEQLVAADLALAGRCEGRGESPRRRAERRKQ